MRAITEITKKWGRKRKLARHMKEHYSNVIQQLDHKYLENDKLMDDTKEKYHTALLELWWIQQWDFTFLTLFKDGKNNNT